MRRRKGFTFMELVVVIAIFGVLVGVITPAWATYVKRSKFRAQNNKAKAIFNAAQVVVTDLEFAERQYRTDLGRIPTSDATQKNAAAAYIFTPVDKENPDEVVEWYYYWNGNSGSICNVSGGNITTSASADTLAKWNEKLGNSIKRIVTDDMVYKIYVRDYQIQSVVCSDRERSRYIGAHPTTITQLSGRAGVTASNIHSLENTNVKDVDPTWFDLDVDNDGTGLAGDDEEDAEDDET